MGDRGNIVVSETGEPGTHVFLYTHWGGSGIHHDLQTALARLERWTDDGYLTRIIFCEMIAHCGAEALTDENGYGISCSYQDNEHCVLRVLVAKQKIELHLAGPGNRPDFNQTTDPVVRVVV